MKNKATTRKGTRKTEISVPYIIRIKNNSYEYIKNFSLNNIAQALGAGEKYDNRISVESEFQGTNYLSFIKEMDSLQPRLGVIRKESIHDYPKYKMEQLIKPIELQNKTSNGKTEKEVVIFLIYPNQFFHETVYQDVDFKLKEGWDIKTDLMPEACIRIYLYPSEINNVSYARPQTGIGQSIKVIRSKK